MERWLGYERLHFDLTKSVISGDLERARKLIIPGRSVIIFDGDGIIFDSPRDAIREFNNRTGLSMQPYQIYRWDVFTAWALEHTNMLEQFSGDINALSQDIESI